MLKRLMNKFVRQLVSVWIALALLVAPVPAMSLAQISSSNDHCMTGQQRAGAQHSPSQHQPNSEAAMPGCVHCASSDGCADGACSDQDCSSFQSSTTFMANVVAQFSGRSEIFSLTTLTDLFSRTAPPLLRPPA
jgi:hypothetical protein